MAKEVLIPVGDEHVVSMTRTFSSYNIKIDGEDCGVLKQSSSSIWFGAMEDYPIVVGGVPYILSVRGRKIRLAANGVYLDNGEVYAPKTPIPAWFWIFAVLNLLIPIVSLGGAVNALIGLVGATICANIVRKPTMTTMVKIIICLLVTAAAWAIWLFFIGIMSNILN